MLGTRLGPYQIDSELGSGGMGTVYLGRDEAARKVAIKVVHPHLLALPGVHERFQREAEVGTQLVNDNVVRTLGVSSAARDDGTAHFLVMEYVEGQTLRDLLAEMEMVSEDLCCHIAVEVAKALEGIHGAGIIHRDLKPENVLITRDHVVKVMDLGLARVQDEAARLSAAGEFAGSVHYAAPEQFVSGGDSLDGRADLYALGLTLYELATGHHPFGEDDIAAVMHKQINEMPRSPAELCPQLSPLFEELVMQLLKKDRAERFASAGALRAALEKGEESAWWTRRAGEIAQTKKPLRRVRIPRETALYGREEQLDTLCTLYRTGGVLLLRGEAGVGKTRLVDELASRLNREGEDFHFLFGSSPPGGAATAAGAFVSAYEPIAPRLSEVLPESRLVAAFHALLEGGPPPDGVEPLSKDAMQVAFARVTEALAREKPTVVLIDDLHFAPEEGRALFASLAAAVAGQRVLLVGTLRPGLPPEWIGELERLPHVKLLDVPRLGPKDLHGLLEEALGSRRLAEQLGGQIAWKSDGNPFFVFEILQGLRADGLIRAEKGEYIKTQVIRDLTVPSSLRDLIHARIAGLSEEDRNLLEVAACAGFEFDPAVVGEALGIARIPLLRRLGALEKNQRLVHAVGRRFRFDHHQVCEALYDELGELLREEYHAALGDVLEAHGGDSVALCEHFLKGGRGEKAKPHLIPALDFLEINHRNTAALEMATRALAVPGLLEGVERLEVMERRAQRFNVLGHYEESMETYREMRALACDLGDPQQQIFAAARLANLYVNVARYDDAVGICKEALVLARELDHPDSLAGCAVIYGNALMYQGLWDECQRVYEEGVAVREPELVLSRIGCVGNLGWARACAGRYREALELSDRVLPLADEEDWGRAINLGYRITYFRDVGQYDDARAVGAQTFELTREMGYRWGEATALHELAAVDEETGDAESARDRYESALEIRREIGYTAGIADTLACLGRLAGDRARLEEARDIATKIGTPTPLVIASAYLGADAREWWPRARRRQAIEAALVSGDKAEAQRMLEALDVPDRATLDNVRVFRDVGA